MPNRKAALEAEAVEVAAGVMAVVGVEGAPKLNDVAERVLL